MLTLFAIARAWPGENDWRSAGYTSAQADDKKAVTEQYHALTATGVMTIKFELSGVQRIVEAAKAGK